MDYPARNRPARTRLIASGGEASMRTVVSVLLLIPLALAGCVATGEGDDGSGMGSGSGSSAGTKVVSIDVVDAVISPGMANKEPWDGFGTTIRSAPWS